MQQVFPGDPNGPKEMHILNRHLYRSSKAEDEDKPALSIPLSLLQEVIEAHEEYQASVKARQDMRKHLHEDQSLRMKRNLEAVKNDVSRFKRRRQQ